jgi:hypothetical protein
MEYNSTSDNIIGADSAFLNFAAANFGDAGTESNKDGSVNLRVAIDNLFVSLGNRINDESEPKNYDDIKKLLLLYNSNNFNSKLGPFMKDDIETLTVKRFNRILTRLGSDLFNPQSLEIVKPIEFDNRSCDKLLEKDLSSFIKQIINEYQDVVQELMSSNDLLNNKILAFEAVRKNVEMVTNLPINEATDKIYGGLTHYLQIFYKENDLETNFIRFMNAYKRFLLYKKFIGIAASAEPEHRDPLCAVCISEPVNHVFVPCGHTFCGPCTKRLTGVCFICRTEIRQKMRIYFN